LPGWSEGMSISGDGKWLLYPQVDGRSIDLMMIENWKVATTSRTNMRASTGSMRRIIAIQVVDSLVLSDAPWHEASGSFCNPGNPEYIPQDMLSFSPGHGKKEIAENCRQCGETIENFLVHILIPSDCKSPSPSEKRVH
jgi:hypothetical protein